MTEKTCQTCQIGFTPKKKAWRAVNCDNCRAADPHRHRAREARAPEMFAACDIESKREGERQIGWTVSFGREDDSSATHEFGPGREGIWAGLQWLVDNLSGPYTDAEGKLWRQAAIGFHLNHDAAVYGVAFNEEEMMLIHKSIRRFGELTPLCNTEHPLGPGTCERIHRLDPIAIRDNITDGGEGDLISYHPGPDLALAFTPGRRIYMEHRPSGDRMEGRKVLDIHDVGRAFTGSLEVVIDTWRPELSPERRDIIRRGKAARPLGFPGWGTPDLAAYSEAECVGLARSCRLLIDMVRAECHVVIKPSKLFGAGSVANATLKHYGAPKRKETELGEEVQGLMTYFGGMIETTVIGRVRAFIAEVDINSAYPDKLRHAPCMKAGCGEWKKGRDLPAHAIIGSVMVQWDVTEDPTSTPPFMVRDTAGNVFQPQRGTTMATIPEYRAGAERFGDAVKLHRAFWWEPSCQCGNLLPFAFLEPLYQRRLAIKQSMKQFTVGSDDWYNLKVREEAIKLVLNSMYGKMAQQRPDFGIYTNLHIAAYVTGATRAQVRKQTWETEARGGVVIYQHTDSVKSIWWEPLDGGKVLGAWGREADVEDFFIIQPGFAVPILKGGKGSTRGVRKDDVYEALPEWLEFVDLTTPPNTWPPFVVNTTRMVSRRQAIARGKPWTAGTFEDGKMDITMRSHKRNTEATHQLPGLAEAWVLPPKLEVLDQATWSDRVALQAYWDEEARTYREL